MRNQTQARESGPMYKYTVREAKWIKGHRKGAEPLGETGQEGEERNREEPS